MPKPAADSLSLDTLTTHQRSLGALAAQLLSDHHGGEDVVQEALWAAYSSQPAVSPGGLGAWLRTVVRRSAGKERQRRAARELREAAVAAKEVFPSAAALASRAETARVLHDAVEGLDPRLAAVIRDVYFGELSIREIAERDGVSQETLRSRLKRARERLRADLEKRDAKLGDHWAAALIPLASVGRTAVHGGAGRSALVTGALGALGAGALALVAAALSFDRSSPVEDPSDLQVGLVAAKSAPISAREQTETQANPSRAREPLLVAAATRTESTLPQTLLTGRVVDPDGLALPGALVEIGRKVGDSPWPDAGELSLEPNTMGFSVLADEDGRFLLALPFDGSSGGLLRVRSDRYHAIGTLHLGQRDLESRGFRLDEGTVNLDAIVLDRCGVVCGRVMDATGKKVDPVDVSIRPGFAVSYALFHKGHTRIGSDGRFEILHAPVGGRGLVIEATGFASRFIESVPVEAGQAVEVGTIILERAGKLSGVVVDGKGRPVSDQKVRAFGQTRNGPYSEALTDKSGRFLLQLKETGLHRVVVKRKGFEPFGQSSEEAARFAPGTDDIIIPLTERPEMTFQVIDALTEMPVEAFELRVVAGAGSGAEKPTWASLGHPRFRQHSGGTVVTTGVESIDEVLVKSPDHLLFRADVERDDTDDGAALQTIRLVHGASIRGQCVYRGKPLPGALITASGHERINERSSLVEYETAADENGDFCVAGLGEGIFELLFVHLDDNLVKGTRKGVKTNDLPIGGAVALGAVELGDPGSIRGRVLAPPGVDPSGLRVMVQPWQQGVIETASSTGEFLFPRVGSGEATIQTEDREGILFASRETVVEVPPNGTGEALIDLRDCGTANLTLHLASLDVELERLRFRVSHGALKPREERYSESGLLTYLPAPDSKGLIRSTVRASGPAHLEVSIDGGVRWLLPALSIELVHGEEAEACVEIELGGVNLALPNGCKISNGDRLDMDFTLSGFPHRPTRLVAIKELGSPASRGGLLPEGTLLLEREIRIPSVPEGTYEITVRSKSFDRKALRGHAIVTRGKVERIELR